LEEFQSLFFRGVDGDDPNPGMQGSTEQFLTGIVTSNIELVCSDPQYYSTILKILPNLQILDGKSFQISAESN
jgi:hypothetical protein